MRFIRIAQIIIGLAGLTALALGLLHWVTGADIINAHMFFGLLVAIGLLLLGIVGAMTSGLRALGIVGIVYAPIIPIFGFAQRTMLIGDLHWLIQVAHMLVGLGALALMGAISARYLNRKLSSVQLNKM